MAKTKLDRCKIQDILQNVNEVKQLRLKIQPHEFMEYQIMVQRKGISS